MSFLRSKASSRNGRSRTTLPGGYAQLLKTLCLEDDQVLEAVYDAQGQRHPRSRTRGRHQTPAEVVLRMLILKHVRNWSYETLEREVRANVVYRSFCRIGM